MAASADKSVKKIYLIFKTHLDLGFTDMANAVFRHYMDNFIPAALRLARTLRESGSENRFVWTTGSWLIYHYLEQASPADQKRMEEAVLAGDIAWHALPFTMHCELMDADLFRFGLSLSQKLDRRFGRTTIAAKMTDVPGHSRAIVPLLVEAGVKLLHIGVNEASTMPHVPPVFIWHDEESRSDLLVVYEHSYGGIVQVNGLHEALVLQMTGDNIGPPGQDTVYKVYRTLHERFPAAEIVPTTLDTFAADLEKVRDSLPVVTEEIGDTWIHGVGTDPQKVRVWRELVRLRREIIASSPAAQDSASLFAFQDALLCVAEHTWGMDTKLHLANFHSYSAREFAAVRPSLPFQSMEASWAEQRQYLDQAVTALEGSQWYARAIELLAPLQSPGRTEAIPESGERPPEMEFNTPHFDLALDPHSGAICYLRTRRDGRVWADPNHPLAWFRCETFDQADYDRFWQEYIQGKDRESVVAWAQYDYAKPGMAGEAKHHPPTPALLESLRVDAQESGTSLDAVLRLPPEWTSDFGAPPLITLQYRIDHASPQIDIRLSWVDKPACRLPEAFWLSFVPIMPDATYRLEKLSRWIDPTRVNSGGNRSLHAVFDRIICTSGDRTLTIVTRDAPLVAVGAPALLRFRNTLPDPRGGVHVNLFNNVWGTNFPQWNEGDASFSFQLVWNH